MLDPRSTSAAARGFALALGILALWAPIARGDGEGTVVYLVRHAEKMLDGGADPPLDRRGLERAATLAQVLQDAEITHVHSTDLLRTRRTAQPISDRLGLAIEIYDPGGLKDLASKLRSTPGRHLVSGHSNTTPEVVRLLGGDPGTPIDEATEYDRLYVLVLGGDGTATTILLRY